MYVYIRFKTSIGKILEDVSSFIWSLLWDTDTGGNLVQTREYRFSAILPVMRSVKG